MCGAKTWVFSSHTCLSSELTLVFSEHVYPCSKHTHMSVVGQHAFSTTPQCSSRHTHICGWKTHVCSRNTRVCFQNTRHMSEWRNAGRTTWPQQDVPGVNDLTSEALGGLESADLKLHARPPPGLLRHRWVVPTAKRRRRPTVRCLKGGSSVTPHLLRSFAQAGGRLGAGPGNGLLRTPQAGGAWEQNLYPLWVMVLLRNPNNPRNGGPAAQNSRQFFTAALRPSNKSRPRSPR